MYEIWLVMNIVWELALANAPLLLAALLLWVILLAAALRRRPRWGAALPPALLVGVAVAVLAFLAVPTALKSSFGDMGYWVDWANLLAIACGFGAAALAFAWPLVALRGGSRAA